MTCSENATKCENCDNGYGHLFKNETDTGDNCDCSLNSSYCSFCLSGTGPVLYENGTFANRCQTCPDNCRSCYANYSICAECYPGFGFVLDKNGNSTGQCSKCPNNCKSCSQNSEICDDCMPKFGPVIVNGVYNGKCESCPKNCLSCDSDHLYCDYCDDNTGYIIDNENQQIRNCGLCPTNCNSCQYSNSCDACKDGFGYANGGKNKDQCVKCEISNCRICSSNSAECDSCNSGYGIVTDSNDKSKVKCEKCSECGFGFVRDQNNTRTGQCEKCPANCDECPYDHEICRECKMGYGLVIDENGTSTGKCEKCPEHCSSCLGNSKICNNCEQRYGFELYENGTRTGQCKPCTSNCDNCKNNYSLCTSCQIGYGFIIEKGINTGKCGRCPTDCYNCQSDNSWCESCGDSYYSFNYGFITEKNVLTNKCKQCSSGCGSCLYNADNCSICNNGFGFERDVRGYITGQCIQCNDYFCSDCNQDFSICSECSYGYGIVQGSNGICEKCPSNCNKCKFSTYCNECDDGYGPELNIDGTHTGNCLPCPANCANCDRNHSICYSCQSGYSFKIDESGYSTKQCIACPENCSSCSEDNSICSGCKTGYTYERINGDNTCRCVSCPEHCQSCQNQNHCYYCELGYVVVFNKCEKCPDHCKSCSNQQVCDYCEDGYSVSLKDDSNYGKCFKCPSNCDSCNVETSECYQCIDGYTLQYKEDGTTDGKCYSCPSNCAYCRGNPNICFYCIPGYTNINSLGEINVGACTKCKSPNCLSCIIDSDECYDCEENYSIDTSVNSPYYRKCIPDNYEYSCNVEGCERCIYKLPNECVKCKNGYEIDRNNQCNKILEELPLDNKIPDNKPLNDDDVQDNGTCNLDVYKYGTSNNTHTLTIQLNYENDDHKKPKEIIINNNQITNFVIEVVSGIQELTIKSTPNKNNNFDIIPPSGAHFTLSLDGNSRASIKKADGDITINATQGTNQVYLIEVQPSTNYLTIIPEVPVHIDVINFNSKQSLHVQENKNKNVEITTVKVQQKAEAAISNAKITGAVKIGLSSSLEINENVDLSSSLLELSYSASQGLFDKAPINGFISSNPKGIIINYNEKDTLLAQEKYLIVESNIDFNCNEWINNITNKVTQSKINEYKCPGKEINIYGNEV